LLPGGFNENAPYDPEAPAANSAVRFQAGHLRGGEREANSLSTRDRPMIRAQMSAPRPRYERFLFATALVDQKGEAISVLSILARADLDPWTEAVTLAQLPRKSAACRLLQVMEKLPDIPPPQATLENAERLVALLPDEVQYSIAALVAANERNIRLLAWTFTFLAILIVSLVIWWVNARHLASYPTTGGRVSHIISPSP